MHVYHINRALISIFYLVMPYFRLKKTDNTFSTIDYNLGLNLFFYIDVKVNSYNQIYYCQCWLPEDLTSSGIPCW